MEAVFHCSSNQHTLRSSTLIDSCTLFLLFHRDRTKEMCMVLWLLCAKGRDGWQDTALLCSLRHAHCAIFQHLHPTRHIETHTQGESEMFWPTNLKTTQEQTEKECTGGRGTKAGRGSAHCDAKEYHISRPSLGEQWNIEATITLYLSFWTTSVMGAHTLCVRWFLTWPAKHDPVRSDPGEFHLDKHMQLCAQIYTHTHTANLYIQLYTHAQKGEAVLSKISSQTFMKM